jgi:predicted membrane metal-binding protein
MNERIKVTIGIFLVGGYIFLRFLSLHRLLANRTSKPKITFKTGLEAAVAIIAVTLFWKWSIGFPWSVALIFALIVAAGAGLIGIAYYSFCWRDK